MDIEGYFLITVKNNIVTKLEYSPYPCELENKLKSFFKSLNSLKADVKLFNRRLIVGENIEFIIKPYTPEVFRGRKFSKNCKGDINYLHPSDRARIEYSSY